MGGREAAIEIAEAMGKMYRSGVSEVTLPDDIKATLDRNGYGSESFNICSVTRNEDDHDWSVSACADRGMDDQLGSGPSLYIHQRDPEQSYEYDLRTDDGELPEWTFPYVRNFVSVEQIA